MLKITTISVRRVGLRGCFPAAGFPGKERGYSGQGRQMRYPRGTTIRGITKTALMAVPMLTLIAGPGNAMLGVRPSRIDFLVSPGSRKQFSIRVSNGSKDPLACEMNARSFAMTPEGLPHGTPDPNPRSLAPWIAMSPARFVLAGGTSQQVNFTVAIPREAAGGYYAVIEAFGKPTKALSDPGNGASIQFSFQANTVVMGVVKGRGVKPELTLKGVELTRMEPGKGGVRPWSLTATVEDTGNVHTVAEGSAEIKTTSGVRVWQGRLLGGMGTVIPGFPRNFTNSEIHGLPDGRYIVSIEIRSPAQRLTLRGLQGFEVAGSIATAANASGPLWARTGGLEVTPSAVMFAGPARSRRTAMVSLTNNLKKKVSCKLTVSPWRITSGGLAGPCTSQDAPRNAAGWVTIRPEAVDLAPGATQRIQITASTPDGVRGEHYAGILVAPKPEDAEGIIPPSVMVTVTPDKTQDLGFVVKSAKVEVAKAGGYQLIVRAQNTGNVRLIPEVQCEVLDSREIRVGDAIPIHGDGQALFPGVVGTWTTLVTRILPPGKYSLRVLANAEKDTPGTGLTVPFSIPLVTGATKAGTAPGAKAPVAKPRPAAASSSRKR